MWFRQAVTLGDKFVAELKGFWSYVHDDDNAENGRITRLAQDVQDQFEMLTGRQIEIFLDKHDISWGEDWRKKIDDSLLSIDFFIAILTPRYFESYECRRELEYFAERAKALGVTELILPLLYVDVPRLHEDEPLDNLAALVKPFQWEDWRELRFQSVDSEEYRRRVARLAQRLVNANKSADGANITSSALEHDAANDDEDDSPGLLDRLASMEEAIPLWTETNNSMVEEIRHIGSLSNEAAEDVRKSDNRGQGFGGRLTIARSLAKKMREPSEKIWSLGNTFTSQLHLVDDGIRLIIERAPIEVRESPESRSQFCSFFDSIQELADASDEGLGATQELIDAISPIESMSQDLRKPMRRLRQGLTLVFEGREITGEWVQLIEASGIDCDNVSSDSMKKRPEAREREVTDLDARDTERMEDVTMDNGMEKHTISVGSGRYGETVAFTANKLGTAVVNDGQDAPDGLDLTIYRLPDNTYRVLAEKGDISLLEPSNFMEVFDTGQPAEYGSWTYEEAAADKTYGEMFTKYMEQHPEGRKREVRDLD